MASRRDNFKLDEVKDSENTSWYWGIFPVSFLREDIHKAIAKWVGKVFLRSWYIGDMESTELSTLTAMPKLQLEFWLENSQRH